jgi:cytochrome c oxidase subunit II
LFCAEYCGLQHAFMTTAVVVMPPYDFEEWLADTTQVLVADTEQPGAQGCRY